MSDWADASTDDLRARVASGVVLVAVGLGSVWAGGPWLAAAAGAAATAMSFEWARMTARPSLLRPFLFTWVPALAAVMAASWSRFDAAAAALGLGAVAAALARGPGKRRWAAFGVLYVGAPCAAFVWLRERPEGVAMILSLFAVIWSADTLAYFGGRALGGPRLAPSLSPNKTWAGLVCGALAGGVAASVLAGYLGGSVLVWAVIGFCFAALGLAGDLFESLLKRRFGVKDASNLIPGHGGVMDRLDGMMAATTVAAILAACWPGAFASLTAGGK